MFRVCHDIRERPSAAEARRMLLDLEVKDDRPPIDLASARYRRIRRLRSNRLRMDYERVYTILKDQISYIICEWRCSIQSFRLVSRNNEVVALELYSVGSLFDESPLNLSRSS
jgi:hypothetical protein